MHDSIRWSLLGWHTLILLAALAGFGVTLFQLVRRARLDEIDVALEGSAHLLAAKVAPTNRRGRGDFPDEDQFDINGDGEITPAERRSAIVARYDLDGDGILSGEERRAFGRDRLNARLELPESLAENLAGDGSEVPYFIIWWRDGEVLKKSNLPEDLVFPSIAAELPETDAGLSVHSQRGSYREVLVSGSFGTRVLVGRSIKRELEALDGLRNILLGVGLGVLFLGFSVGALLVTRALRPIKAIGSTARAISASDLSKRIDVASTKSELGDLANVLNATFDRLQSAFEHQVRFTQDASHELRTPVSVIVAESEYALRKERSPQEYRDSAQACLRAATRVTMLIDGLLTLARTDAPRFVLEKQDVDLSGMVEECAAVLSPLAKNSDVSVRLELNPVHVQADPGLLDKVVTNLLVNAIKFNHSPGEVVVTLKSTAVGAELAVSDTGPGIPPEEQSAIFERFYRVDKARSGGSSGSGLGLAISKAIIEAHRGSLECQSEIGAGAKFTVRLPGGGD